jgi:hypothetical protein
MPTPEPTIGDHYVITEPFEAIVLVHFFAPFTDGSHRTLPIGLGFTILGNPVSGAAAVSAGPVDPDRWARDLVSSENLNDQKYAGYSLVINRGDLASRCAVVR